MKSHLAKRLKEELNAQNATNSASTSKQTSEIITQDVTSSAITTSSPSTPTTTASTICLPTQEVTIHVRVSPTLHITQKEHNSNIFLFNNRYPQVITKQCLCKCKYNYHN